MKISLIAAIDRNRLIGNSGQIPWRLPADLRQFKATTMGKPLIMGRKTHESIGKPLPGRHNIVLTRQPDYTAPGCTVVHSIEEALQAARPAQEVMIAGGGDIYRQFLPLAQRLYLTLIDAAFDGDTYFPEFKRQDWDRIAEEEHAADARNPYPFRVVVLERKSPGGRTARPPG